jgi:cyclohexyl-isocyanide hydratase
VVVDRNRITAGGVTAGIDFALRIASDLAGAAAAERIALELEYDPDPPFRGHPRVADPAVLSELRRAVEESVRARRALLQDLRR